MAQAPVNISEETHFLNLNNVIVETIIQQLVDEDERLVNAPNDDVIREAIVDAIDDIRQAIGDIQDSFNPPRRDQRGRGFPNIDLSPLPYRCAYVQHLGTLGMGLARLKVLEALRNCEALRNEFGEGCVNVVCLGGGPGTDVVGLTSALYECGIKNALNITIVDSLESWSSFVGVLDTIVRQGDYGNASKYFRENAVSLSFIRGQLPKDANATEAIRRADVILMIRFISSIEGDKNQADVIQHVRENMRNGAIAIVVDSPFYKENWWLFKDLEEWSGDREAYRISANLSGARFGNVASESGALLGVFRRNVEREKSLGFPHTP